MLQQTYSLPMKIGDMSTQISNTRAQAYAKFFDYHDSVFAPAARIQLHSHLEIPCVFKFGAAIQSVDVSEIGIPIQKSCQVKKRRVMVLIP